MQKYYAFIYSFIERGENILSFMPGNKPSEMTKTIFFKVKSLPSGLD